MKPFFITTAIDYTNGAPHIGHAYEKVLADVLARYHRLKGDDAFYLTGVDQHGQKVQQSAEKEGIAPQEFVDQVTGQFRSLWTKLDIAYDGWAATTEPSHKDCVRTLLTRLNREGQIYKDKRGGYYSVRQEQFLTDKERGPDGEFGPEWGHVEFREEENYYFKLAEHKQWLLDLIDARTKAGTPLVLPDFRVSELRNAVEKLEGDLCISRPKARLAWGIEFPFDPDFVTYVWFDALVNYISFAPGYDAHADADLTEFKKWWPALHVIGKDIMIPAHGVYWPIMLKGIGFADEDIPQLLVHGWWNIDGAKMSKSTGNVVDPDALAGKYGAEAVRYYLVADIATGKDSDFSEERLLQRYNTDLANSLGNLLNRTLSMTQKYRSGKISQVRAESQTSDTGIWDTIEGFVVAEKFVNLGDERVAKLRNAISTFTALLDDHIVNLGSAAIFDYITSCNQLIDNSAPWKLAKDETRQRDLDAVLYHLAESLRIIAILIAPILPKAAEGIFTQLNWNGPMTIAEAVWGKLPDGHQLGAPTPLFPRIETPADPS